MGGSADRPGRIWRSRSTAAAITTLAAATALSLAACSAPGGTADAVGSSPTTATRHGTPVSVPPLTSSEQAPTTTSADPAPPTSSLDPATSAEPPVPSSDPPAPSTTHQAAPVARISTSLATGRPVNPAQPITVNVAHGTLTSVRLVNPKEGITVTGKLSADRRSWTSTEALGYGKGYQLAARAVSADGTASATREDFSTLTPPTLTLPSFQTIGGYPLQDHGTFGVGMVVVVHFDEPIADEAAAQQALHVTTSPHVAGSWYWADDQDAHWRPKNFYAAGTKVTVDAEVYGVKLGPGLYGQSDESVSFTIGRAQITRAYDNAPNGIDKVVVSNGAGTVLRTMNTSMGQHGGETVNGQYINFYTMGGTYTVIAHENPAIMSSASYGLPADAPGGYAPEAIYWSTRISTDGIYLHELNSTIWAQDSGQDVSHGCLNLDTANATWFFQHSLIGDPVIIKGASGAPAIQLWQGGDWSVPWSTWLKGSALR